VETLTWSSVELHLREGSAWLLPMGGARGAEIGYDPRGGWLFLHLPGSLANAGSSQVFRQFEVRSGSGRFGPAVEIATHNRELFREFHMLASLLTERMERGEGNVQEALDYAVARWQALLAKRTLLSPEQQLGLYGELAVLAALIDEYGPEAVAMWVGPAGDSPMRHDFRIRVVDLEVKTTGGSQRKHVFHGLNQCVPAPGHELYIVSLRCERTGPGGGQNLPERVAGLRSRLAASSSADSAFCHALEKSNYYEDDAAAYDDRLLLADAPRLVPVDARFPRIVTEMLHLRLDEDVASRIEDVSYRANLDGMGWVQGSEEFVQALGKVVVK
jgi:hypothetical protein